MKKQDEIKQNIKNMTREELENFAVSMHTKQELLQQENAWYKEQVKLQQKKLFGKSSEKNNPAQISLFDEAEIESTPIHDESNITEVKSHQRKKKTKLLSLDDLHQTTIEYTVSGEETICSTCQSQLHVMSKHIRREIVFIAPRIEVVNHVEYIYSCRHCQSNEITTPVLQAKGPTPLIKGSYASSSLVANIINDKYVKALPLYRQEVSYQRLGININRQNMSNWIQKVANDYFKPMNQYMYKQLAEMEYISADETSVQVLHEPGKQASSKSYMWVYMSGRSEEKQIVLYQYEQSRAHHHAVEYLKEYKGILLSDGYQAYDKISDVVQAGCWAHVRRKFSEALDLVPKGTKKEDTQTYELYCLINQLFKIEKDNKKADYEVLKEIRQRKAVPIVDEFFMQVHKLEDIALPKSHFGKAITYAINQETKLRTYLSDGRVEISNNTTERAIRPFTIGRNNWLFMNSVKGAEGSSYIYSLVETAKANHLKPYEYINYVLTELPGKDMGDEEILETVMPWASLPKELYNTKKS